MAVWSHYQDKFLEETYVIFLHSVVQPIQMTYLVGKESDLAKGYLQVARMQVSNCARAASDMFPTRKSSELTDLVAILQEIHKIKHDSEQFIPYIDKLFLKYGDFMPKLS